MDRVSQNQDRNPRVASMGTQCLKQREEYVMNRKHGRRRTARTLVISGDLAVDADAPQWEVELVGPALREIVGSAETSSDHAGSKRGRHARR